MVSPFEEVSEKEPVQPTLPIERIEVGIKKVMRWIVAVVMIPVLIFKQALICVVDAIDKINKAD